MGCVAPYLHPIDFFHIMSEEEHLNIPHGPFPFTDEATEFPSDCPGIHESKGGFGCH